MGDVEQGHSLNVLHSDNCFLVAVVATLVLTASSAIIYRTKHLGMSAVSMSDHSILNATLATLHLADPSPGNASVHPSEKVSECHTVEDASSHNNDETRDYKNSRSKERRRRGKDPLKEIMKGGKKLKGFSKSSRPNTADGDGTGLTSATGSIVQAVGVDTPQESCRCSVRSPSISNERTVSVPSSYAGTPEGPGQAATEREQGKASSIPGTYDTSRPSASTVPEFTHFHETNSRVDMGNTPGVSLSSSSMYSDSTSSLSTSGSTSNTSPNSDSQHDAFIHASRSLPYFTSDKRSIKPLNQTFTGPWDWDGRLSPNLSGNDTTYRKPPRFRSKSRVPNSVSQSPMVVGSKSYPVPFTSAVPYSSTSTSTSSSPSISLSSIPSAESSPSSFVFPTLNSASPSSSSGPSSNSDDIQHNKPTTHEGASTSTGNTPRRAPAPLRTPTGSAGSTPPPLSNQTQIASLRGALEAARMREEKSKLDADRYSKECEMLKWKWREEAAAWKTKEQELYTQITLLTQQLQGYVAAFSPSPNSPAHFQFSNPNHLFPLQQQSPHLPSHVLMHHPTNSQIQPHSHSPFFTYQNPSPNQQPAQPNLLSLLFPVASSGGGGPPSASGTSSAGSTSPRLDSSPLWDRGRRRTRTIRSGDTDVNEDWLVSEELDSAAGAEGDDDFNDVLADAILKRPESIRVRAREERQETVFTFPSISSGFGNVDRNKGTARRVEVENREEMMVSGPTVSSRHGSTTVDDHHPAG